jgi:hypothetical protein
MQMSGQCVQPGSVRSPLQGAVLTLGLGSLSLRAGRAAALPTFVLATQWGGGRRGLGQDGPAFAVHPSPRRYSLAAECSPSPQRPLQRRDARA